MDVLCRYAISPCTELSTLDKPITLTKTKKDEPRKDENHPMMMSVGFNRRVFVVGHHDH